jgi:hypothetical protein
MEKQNFGNSRIIRNRLFLNFITYIVFCSLIQHNFRFYLSREISFPLSIGTLSYYVFAPHPTLSTPIVPKVLIVGSTTVVTYFGRRMPISISFDRLHWPFSNISFFALFYLDDHPFHNQPTISQCLDPGWGGGTGW